MRRVAFLFLSLTACAGPARMGVEVLAGVRPCVPAATRPLDKILGGQAVALGDPDRNLVAMLRVRRSGGDSVCTGALISDRVLLTAAHCVDGAEIGEVETVFDTGEGCPIDQRKTRAIATKRLVLHREFDGTPRSLADLALVMLDHDAPRDQQRLSLIQPGERPTNDRLLFIGYGITGETEKDAQVLRRVYKSYKGSVRTRDRALVIDQRDRAGFCRGDSGAPLIAEVYGEPRILGVNSANVGVGENTECHELSVAMDALFFADWIARNRRALDHSTWLSRIFASSVERL